MTVPSSDIAFSASVKQVQSARGSREYFEKMEAEGGFRTLIDARLSAALTEANSIFLVTASAAGQPYAQHRGGPKGFIHVLDEHTIGFAELVGNQQFITTGNLSENSKAFLILMDYARRRRFKIWGRARIVEGDAALVARLMPESFTVQSQAVILFEVDAWDTNCPRNIPKKLDADIVDAALAERDAKIARLKAELAALQAKN